MRAEQQLRDRRGRGLRADELVETDERSVELRSVTALRDDLFQLDSPSRSRPRRPTGAAADYARGVDAGPRRTVRINGHGAQTALRPTPSELRGPRPDRIAAWGVAFAIFLALLAALMGG